MKVVGSGDWHLDWYTAGRSRFADLSERVEEVMREARTADLFVFLGDLANPDSRGVHRATERACEVASELARLGVPSVWIAGNHDVVEDGNGTSTLSALTGIERGGATKLIRVFEHPAAALIDTRRGEKVAFAALPFPPRSDPYDPSDFVSKLQAPPAGVPLIIAGHLWLQNIDPGSESTDLARGRSVYWPADAIEAQCLKGTFDRASTIIIGGHYHNAGSFELGRPVADPTQIHIAGSLERLTFGDESINPRFIVMEYL